MKILKLLMVVCSLLAVTGCAAIFGRSTDDPAIKLKWAAEHYNNLNEPQKAEKLIVEAIQIYTKNNDQFGLAEAYRNYGLFFRSRAVEKFEKTYRDTGFLDTTAKSGTRLAKSIEYFNKARTIYADYGRLDALSSLDISIAKTYDLMNRKSDACNSFYLSLESFALYKLSVLENDAPLSDEISRYEDYIDELKKQTGCTS